MTTPLETRLITRLPDEFVIESAVEAFGLDLLRHAAEQDPETVVVLRYDRDHAVQLALLVLHCVRKCQRELPS